MGRPPKDPKERKSIPLRIMLTADQRTLIEQAAQSDGQDMTAWARPILLRAAQERLAVIGKEKKIPK